MIVDWIYDHPTGVWGSILVCGTTALAVSDWQARLKRLINYAAAPAEIAFAAAHEAVERQLFGDTAVLRMQYPYKGVSAARPVD